MGSRTVSDVIKWDRDISQHKVVALYGGVGSGKSTFIKKLAKGDFTQDKEYKTVLLITSRKMPVEETLSEEKFIDVFSNFISVKGNVKLTKEDFFFYINYGLLTEENKKYEKKNGILTKSVICTTAKIEWFLRSIYKINNTEKEYDIKNFLFELFDVIVVDEVHSLLTDSSYQLAPFYIWQIIKQFNESCTDPSKHMILMTGTPDPIATILKQICPDLHEITLFKDCRNITPEEIRFIYEKDVKQTIVDLLNNNKKIIYFHNANLYPEWITKDTNISVDNVATIFSDEKKKQEYYKKDKDGSFKLELTQRYIAKYNRLPSADTDRQELYDIRLLLTTSKLQEGINIIDNIDYMFIDSHLPISVVQMCGRVRTGNHIVYIVVDANQFTGKSVELFCKIEQNKISVAKQRLEVFNKEIEQYSDIDLLLKYVDSKTRLQKASTEDNESIEVSELFEDTESNEDIQPDYTEYIAFNYFSDKFEFYELKELMYLYEAEKINEWNNSRYKRNGYKNIVSKWFFKSIKIQNNFTTKEYQSKLLFNEMKFHYYTESEIAEGIRILSNGDTQVVDAPYGQTKIDNLIKGLQKIWNTDNIELKWYLKKFLGFVEVDRCGAKHADYRFIVKDKSLLE